MSVGAFVGRFDVAVAADGAIVIPEEWRVMWGTCNKVCLHLPSDEKCLCIVPEAEAKKEPDLECIWVTVGADSTIKIPPDILNAVGIGSTATATGVIRYFKLWSPEVLAENESRDLEITERFFLG